MKKRGATKTLSMMIVLLIILQLTSNCLAEVNPTPITPNEPFLAAAVQFNPQLNERDKNIDELVKVVTEAAQKGAKLIVTPELSTTGYYYKDRDAIKPFVDTIPGITTSRFEEIAKKYDTYIVIGMAEVDPETDIYYNSAALVGPEGYIGKYRKTHQWELEEHWAAWGDLGVPVFDTKIGKIGINICMDAAYFESARLAALNDADILAFPTNSSAQAIWALQARAMQNGLYIVSANRSNTELDFHMVGASAIWSPSGEKLAEAPLVPTPADDMDEPYIVYAEIDPKQYDNPAKQRLKERRPELYQELMLYIAPWDYTINTTSHDVTAALLQYEPVIGDKEANLSKVKQLLANTKNSQKPVDIVVLPELSLTGPVYDDASLAKKLAEDMDGETVKAFKDLAISHNTYIVFGMIEKENDKLYNTAVIMNRKGEIEGKYRQTHLNFNDLKWATPGDKIEVFSTELGKIGLMIGYDAVFPEVAGVLTVKRADIIAMPTRWNGLFDREIEVNKGMSANEYPEGSMALWDSVAMSAQAYTLIANFVGTKSGYFGRSGLYVLDPLYGLDQPIVAGEDETALIVNFKTLQNDWWFNQQMLINCRRPYFYKPFIKPIE